MTRRSIARNYHYRSMRAYEKSWSAITAMQMKGMIDDDKANEMKDAVDAKCMSEQTKYWNLLTK